MNKKNIIENKENSIKKQISILENKLEQIYEFLDNDVIEFFNDHELRLMDLEATKKAKIKGVK